MYTLMLTGLILWISAVQEESQAPVSAPPDGHFLTYKFREGQVVHYSVRHATTRKSRQGQLNQLVRDTVRENKHLMVTAVRDDGSFVLKTVFDRVRMEAELDAKKVSFDSARPAKEDPPGFANFRKKIARPQFEVHFAPSGKLKAVRRLAAAGTADARAAGRNTDGSSFLVVFPEKPLQVGDTWREEYTVRMPLGKDVIQSIQIFRTYRLNSVEQGIARLSFASSLKTPIRNPEILAKLIQSTPSGTVEFDIEAGQLIGRTMKVDKTVLNHSGPQSVLHTVSTRYEKRVDSAAVQTASRE